MEYEATADDAVVLVLEETYHYEQPAYPYFIN
jgi:hypothetical protein